MARRNDHDPEKITPRMRQALRLSMLLGGQKQAADAMGISYQTVKNLHTEAFRRLGVQSTMEAARVLEWLEVPDA